MVPHSVHGTQGSLWAVYSSYLLGLDPTRFGGALLSRLYLRGLGLRLIPGLFSGNFPPINLTVSNAAFVGESKDFIHSGEGKEGLNPRPSPPVLKASSIS